MDYIGKVLLNWEMYTFLNQLRNISLTKINKEKARLKVIEFTARMDNRYDCKNMLNQIQNYINEFSNYIHTRFMIFLRIINLLI